jgi:hypothetical protein
MRITYQMGCPALGIWVGFLKQPTLPGEAPPKKITNESKVVQKYIIFIFWVRSARQCIRLFKKSDPNHQCNAYMQSWTSPLKQK